MHDSADNGSPPGENPTAKSSTDKAPERRIYLIGMGLGGCRIACTVKERYAFPGLRLVAADADVETLRQCDVDETIQLGKRWTQGEGCGGDMALAERCASSSSGELRDMLRQARLVFVAAGLGGGIGSVGPRVLARLAREMAVPIVCLVTMPFSFEGGRLAAAEEALTLLRQENEAVIAVPNSLLFNRLPPDTTGAAAFRMSTTLLAQALSGLARICCAQGLLVADLAGVKRIVRRPGSTCAMALGQGCGPQAAEEAIRDFFDSPFVGGEQALHDVDAALLTVLGGNDLTIGTVQDCLGKVQQHLPKAKSHTLVGAYTDPRLEDTVQITGLLVREDRKNPDKEPDLFAARPGTEQSSRRSKKNKKQKSDPEGQDMLPFPEQQLGIFAGSSQPTYHNGENLDIPTFQRLNKRIDPGKEARPVPSPE